MFESFNLPVGEAAFSLARREECRKFYVIVVPVAFARALSAFVYGGKKFEESVGSLLGNGRGERDSFFSYGIRMLKVSMAPGFDHKILKGLITYVI